MSLGAFRVSESKLTLAARIALVPYGVSLFLITWLPGSEAERVTGIVSYTARALESWSIPFSLGYLVLEFVANVLLFVPLGLLLRFAWTKLSFLAVLSVSAGTSLLIEVVQIALPSRYPTMSDLIANTAGGSLGYGLALAFLGLLARRSPGGKTRG